MRIFYKGKDGGLDSPVTGYWLVEIKYLFSIVLLKFNNGRREQFHTHAFNALTWFIKGNMQEERLLAGQRKFRIYKRSLIPKLTKRDNLHRVYSIGTSWCFSIRGPWAKTWKEYDEQTNTLTTLTSGRRVVHD